MVTGVLPVSLIVPGYQVTRFSDGSSEKDIMFTMDVLSDIVYIAIPRATNLSDAEINIAAAPTTIDLAQNYFQFAGGSFVNTTEASGLQLVPKTAWWNTSWHYALPLTADAGSKPWDNIPVEVEINLTFYLLAAGISGKTLDENSLRVVEYFIGEPVVFNSSIAGPDKYLVPMNWTKAPDYNADSNAKLNITWLMSGPNMYPSRQFMLYFDTISNGPKPSTTVGLKYWEDVIFANWAPFGNNGYLYKNDNGHFSSTPSAMFPTNASAAVDTGDFNGDGYTDIAFANWYNGSSYNISSFIYPGGPQGVDNVTAWNLSTNGTFGTGVGDVNSDGIDDIVFTGLRSGSNYTVGSWLYYGSVSGPSNSSVMQFYTEGATDAAVADVNNDGLKDVIFACANNGSSGNINSFIYLQNANAFNSTPDILLPTQNAYAVQVADLNKDGWQDLVFANRRNTSVSGPSQYEVDSFVYYGSQTGFNSMPDVRLPTHGALDAKIADLNQDGWPDIIFANYNDGATYNTMSQAYFGGPSGFSTTPGAYFQTSWAYGVDVGDVNSDGYLDVAFANYYDGITTDINSTVFLGPCIGLKQPSIFLPTHGAGDVRIANVDRYDMSSDKNPPTISVGGGVGIEGQFVPNGTYISPGIPADENVLSASVTWNSTIPAQPAGCTIFVNISNDGGLHWVPVDQGMLVNFSNPGKVLKYMVKLASDTHNVVTPVFEDITISYEKESYPYNVGLDVNSDGRDEWSWPGKFNTTAVLNESTMGLATWLMQTVPRIGSGNFTVPFKFSSERPGIIRVFGLNITGNYPPEAMMPIPDIVMTENIPLSSAFNVHNYFRHLDPDPLVYITVGNRNVVLNISANGSVTISSAQGWYGEEHFILRAIDNQGEWADIPMDVEVRHVAQPPGFISKMPDVVVSEGDTVFSAFNLLDHVFDPDTPKTSLIFSVADVSDPNVSVSIDANDNIDVHSKTGWDGVAVVKMKVSDGELSDIAPFNVTVVRHNRPPTVSQLPPVQLGQGERFIHAFNMRNFTSDVDTPMANITFRVEDNSNLLSGVSVDRDGWVNITPDRKWYGVAVVVINASDGEYGVRASFTVTVNPKPTTNPAPATDNTLLYVVMALLVVFIVVFLVDMGLRFRRPRAPSPPRESAEPAVVTLRPVPQPRRMRVQPAQIVEMRPVGPPAEAPPEQIQMDAPAPAIAQEKGLGAGAAAALATAAGEPAPAEERFEVVYTEEGSPGAGGGMAPVPSFQQTPPEQAPAMPPAVPPPSAGDVESFQQTTMMQPEASAEGALPGPEMPEGEAGQRPAGRSAAALLAALQTPAPRAPEAQPAPGPEGILPAPASSAAAAPSPPAPSSEAVPGGEAGEPAKSAPALASKATEGESAATELEQKEVRPITRVRCAGCKAAIPIFSAQRPLVVTCPQCGRMGMLK
jgi:hypothetical protein